MMNLCPFTFMSLHVFYDFASNTKIVHQISFSSASTKTQKSSNLSALQWVGKNRQTLYFLEFKVTLFVIPYSFDVHTYK